GSWAIRPTVRVHESRQHYRGETMILEPELVCEGGVGRIVDFMPLVDGHEDRSDRVRIVEGVDGEVQLAMWVAPRFRYGAYAPWVTREQDGTRFTVGPDALTLR